uniref:Transthyretin-like family protein n=1 Tax=Heterorhabditis bacteriophora TaxID=37862 RepID=A0A1I7XJU0_HETBA
MLRSIVFFCLAGITSGLFWGLVGRDQAVAVTGKFTCNGRPAPNIRVKLYEKEATENGPRNKGAHLTIRKV